MSHSHMNMDMGGGDSSDGSNNNGMNMAFHTSTFETLYSIAWTPKTTGQYAGTIIFLITLAIVQRFLAAFKANQEIKWARADKNRVIVVAGMLKDGNDGKGNDDEMEDASSTSRFQPGLATGHEKPWRKPWRWSRDLPRACLQTVVVGLGYLLMLAVMTLNVGYFMAVISGLFLGELAFGRYTGVVGH